MMYMNVWANNAYIRNMQWDNLHMYATVREKNAYMFQNKARQGRKDENLDPE
jgi:hypothetical protein